MKRKSLCGVNCDAEDGRGESTSFVVGEGTGQVPLPMDVGIGQHALGSLYGPLATFMGHGAASCMLRASRHLLSL